MGLQEVLLHNYLRRSMQGRLDLGEDKPLLETVVIQVLGGDLINLLRGVFSFAAGSSPCLRAVKTYLLLGVLMML